MSNRITNRIAKVSNVRTRAAVLAAGLGASAVLTVGVATAAEGSQQTPDLFAAHTASQLADSTGAQADAVTATQQSWVSPIGGDYSLSAKFGNSGDRWASKHSGQDFAVPVGTDVRAVHSGTVVKAGGNGAGDGPAYGNAIVIKHDDGSYSQYAHLNKIDVKVGQKLNTGDKIAESGNTGNSSGPHLHFEIRTTPDYGSAVDPVAFMQSKGASF
ncbi:M23 family metallopeptidase [Streptomyces sp. JH002]|jgi:murein DD-endopeptidase MepM/ murein hydrolase activator NlpD|uniref:M23 family metallopeptidase n=1 Tax=Streptomyces TaxID=1883 RepID=UPI0019047806|nr:MULTISPECIES: M23 family metallopeptidase [unclassified Streptomyces]MCU4744955.1 M23 family metallopeptidase [Streptomyces sp. G-5]QQN80061.1 M23 family metallopeptidase [Streptomyces sp. XC 2026]